MPHPVDYVIKHAPGHERALVMVKALPPVGTTPACGKTGEHLLLGDWLLEGFQRFSNPAPLKNEYDVVVADVNGDIAWRCRIDIA